MVGNVEANNIKFNKDGIIYSIAIQKDTEEVKFRKYNENNELLGEEIFIRPTEAELDIK